MHKLRVYIDTSVIGGCLDSEFETDSNRLFERFKNGEIIAVVSETTLRELKDAPQKVKELLDHLPDDIIETVLESQEAITLARNYIESNAIPEKSYNDALHIAVATVNRVDVLVSWNFKDIVNITRIHAYNSVNLREGYPLLEIRAPKEILYGEF
ncbi:MAG: PIN domain-containing protein [Elusimicrobia bacterium]|nr:PIN domain-containing protein [Elusimicrobiota bacterium]